VNMFQTGLDFYTSITIFIKAIRFLEVESAEDGVIAESQCW